MDGFYANYSRRTLPIHIFLFFSLSLLSISNITTKEGRKGEGREEGPPPPSTSHAFPHHFLLPLLFSTYLLLLKHLPIPVRDALWWFKLTSTAFSWHAHIIPWCILTFPSWTLPAILPATGITPFPSRVFGRFETFCGFGCETYRTVIYTILSIWFGTVLHFAFTLDQRYITCRL